VPDASGDPLAKHSLSAIELKQLLLAERAGEAFLAFRDTQAMLSIFTLRPESKTKTVGRGAETDLSIAWDGEVSGLHAELECLGGEWTILDDGLSTNGTFINGERIHGRQRLRHADRILMGRTLLAYNAAQPTQLQETVVAGEQPSLKHLSDSQRRVLVALCRPYGKGTSFASPATNQQIADELYLSVDAVKMHLRALFAKFELTELPQNQKRARLAECVLSFGLVSQREIA
jgi:FHA domain